MSLLAILAIAGGLDKDGEDVPPVTSPMVMAPVLICS